MSDYRDVETIDGGTAEDWFRAERKAHRERIAPKRWRFWWVCTVLCACCYAGLGVWALKLACTQILLDVKQPHTALVLSWWLASVPPSMLCAWRTASWRKVMREAPRAQTGTTP